MRPRRLLPLGAAPGGAACGAKAARLSAALRGGFPVLPGWAVPCAESRPAVRVAAAELRAGRPAAGRRAVLSHPPGAALAAELREAVNDLGGRVIVRSSSPLESDPCWSGAFSSLAEVSQHEVVTAVRSCWASAFAVDPLARLAACGLPPEALETGVLIQPEIGPDFGGVARVLPTGREGQAPRAMLGSGSGVEVAVEGVAGHPGGLLSGWADGASARVSLPADLACAASVRRGHGRPAAEGPLVDLAGSGLVVAVARLAAGIHRLLGDDAIEWAACGGDLWLLQSGPVVDNPGADQTARDGRGADDGERGRGPGPGGPGRHLAAREWMPALSALLQERGRHLRGRPAVAGQAAGRLVLCRPHQPAPATCRDAVLLVDRPLPALAPLLFTARGVIARSGAAGSHLAGVARSLAVPMVTGCHPEIVTGGHPPGTPWLAAIDGGTGDVALFPEREDRHA